MFNNLNKEMSEKIIKKQFKLLNKKLAHKNVEVVPTENLINHIITKGTSEEYGAREIVRIINSEIKSKLVDIILFGNLKDGGKSIVDYKDGEIILK